MCLKEKVKSGRLRNVGYDVSTSQRVVRKRSPTSSFHQFCHYFLCLDQRKFQRLSTSPCCSGVMTHLEGVLNLNFKPIMQINTYAAFVGFQSGSLRGNHMCQWCLSSDFRSSLYFMVESIANLRVKNTSSDGAPFNTSTWRQFSTVGR